MPCWMRTCDEQTSQIWGESEAPVRRYVYMVPARGGRNFKIIEPRLKFKKDYPTTPRLQEWHSCVAEKNAMPIIQSNVLKALQPATYIPAPNKLRTLWRPLGHPGPCEEWPVFRGYIMLMTFHRGVGVRWWHRISDATWCHIQHFTCKPPKNQQTSNLKYPVSMVPSSPFSALCMKYQNSFWNDGLLGGFPHSLYFKHHFRLLHEGEKPHQSKKQGQRKEEAQWNHKPPQQPWNAFFSKRPLSKARFTNTPWSCCAENLVHHVNALYQCGSIYADCTCFFLN